MDKGSEKEVNYMAFWDDTEDLKSNALNVEEKKFFSSTYTPQDVVEDPSNFDFITSLYLNKSLAPDKDSVQVEKKI